jgi:phage gp45-like
VAESKFGDVIKRQSPTTLLGAIALVLVVGLAAGFGIGYKVEQSRTKDDLKKAREAASAKAAKKAPGAATAVRLIGKIDDATENNLSVTVNGKPSRKIALRPTTTFVKAVAGTAADITKGSRVVWKAKKGALTAAEEVIVLPAQAKLGILVTAVAPDSVTIKSAKGKDVKVTTTGATIEKVTNATKADAAKGSTVIAESRQTKGVLTATEIIVLPTSTKFV